LVTRRIARLVLLGLPGLAPALVGIAINALPFYATRWLAARFAPAHILVSAARMIVGGILFPATYVALAAALWLLAGWDWPAVAVVLAAAVPLGYFALAFVRWVRAEVEHLALARVASRHLRMVARLRAERRELIRLFDEARVEYLVATGERPADRAVPSDATV
jgi:hypothetical protein